MTSKKYKSYGYIQVVAVASFMLATVPDIPAWRMCIAFIAIMVALIATEESSKEDTNDPR